MTTKMRHGLLAIAALCLPAFAQDAVPPDYVSEIVKATKADMEAYIEQQQQLRETRSRLRQVERQKEIDRLVDEGVGIPPDVIVMQRKYTDERLFANNAPLHETACEMTTVNYDFSYPRPLVVPVASRSPAHI